MDYAEAVNRFHDEVTAAMAKGERHGLTDKEMIDELRRIADENESEIKNRNRSK
jgi:hypothetical protein